MPKVWMRDDPKGEARFHRAPTCRQLVKRSKNGRVRPLIEVDLDDVGVRPCLTCYPDAPRLAIRHTYCQICESRYACEHNGGVRITRRDGYQYYTWPDSNQMPRFRKTL